MSNNNKSMFLIYSTGKDMKLKKNKTNKQFLNGKCYKEMAYILYLFPFIQLSLQIRLNTHGAVS